MAVEMQLLERGERVADVQEVDVFDRAITFDEYLRLYEGAQEHVELVKGVPATRTAASLPHEDLYMWIVRLLGDYTETRDLGKVNGSRTAVKVTDYDGRLPDVLFVRKERLSIRQYMFLSEAPDLVIELLSPDDRPSHKARLEVDYRSIGVPEIIFVDAKRRRVEVQRRTGDTYGVEVLTAGVLRLDSIEGLWLDLDWLLEEKRPTVREALAKIEAGA